VGRGLGGDCRVGRSKQKWFATFLHLQHGIPSNDTFGRVFAALGPEAFKAESATWVRSLATGLPGEVVAIDGKTLLRTCDTGAETAAISGGVSLGAAAFLRSALAGGQRQLQGPTGLVGA